MGFLCEEFYGGRFLHVHDAHQPQFIILYKYATKISNMLLNFTKQATVQVMSYLSKLVVKIFVSLADIVTDDKCSNREEIEVSYVVRMAVCPDHVIYIASL